MPLIAASSRALLPWVVPGRDLPDLLAILFVPVVTALARAHRGNQQLAGLSSRPGIVRKLLLGFAIVILLLFDALVGILLCARDAPLATWLIAASVYVIYLLLVIPALRPARQVL